MVFGKQGLFTLCLLAATSFAVRAQEFSLESAGVRGGASYTSAAHNFHQAEAFANWDLPWDWNLNSGWRLQAQLQVSAGGLADPGGDAFIGTLGPGLLLGRDHFLLSFDAGVSPTLLSRHDFGTKDFGTLFQFTSHVGLSAGLGSRVRIGYRFQHMSNSGLGSPNPGLNLHFLAVSYKF